MAKNIRCIVLIILIAFHLENTEHENISVLLRQTLVFQNSVVICINSTIFRNSNVNVILDNPTHESENQEIMLHSCSI